MNETQIYQRFKALGKVMLIPSITMLLFFIYLFFSSLSSYITSITRRSNPNFPRQHVNFDSLYVISMIFTFILIVYFSILVYNSFKFIRAHQAVQLSNNLKSFNIIWMITVFILSIASVILFYAVINNI